MKPLIRIMLVMNAYFCLLIAMRRGLDPRFVEAWRSEDAIWGPDGLPFNMAALLLAGLVSFSIARSGARSRENRAWLLALFALQAVLTMVEAYPGFLIIFGAVLCFLDDAFWFSGREVPPASNPLDLSP